MLTVKLKASAKPSYLESIEDHGKFFLIRLKGEIDTDELEEGREKMTEIIEKAGLYRKSNICDFGSVTHADTATVAALIDRFMRFRKEGRGKMIFINVRGELKSLFEIAHLSEVFMVHQTLEEAVAALS